jgi:hypothetical protein
MAAPPLAFSMAAVIVPEDGIPCRDQLVHNVAIAVDMLGIAVDEMDERLGGTIGEPCLPV